MSLALHELAHAWTAWKLGDPTAKEQGRPDLQSPQAPRPARHGDVRHHRARDEHAVRLGETGPRQPRFFRRPKEGMALVAAAGPATNFLLALAALAVLVHTNSEGEAAEVTFYAYLVNVVLGIFNLIPIPPLDGSRIVGIFMSDATYRQWARLDMYGMVVGARAVHRLPQRVVPSSWAKRLRRGDTRHGANRRCLSLVARPPVAPARPRDERLMPVELIDWDAPGPYRVAFSTRSGGVSDGDFRSLNLGLRTEDEPGHVIENRRRLAEPVDADAEPGDDGMAVPRRASRRARPVGFVTPGRVWERCDGLWTDEPGQPMMLLTADCLPVAVCRAGGAPALALLHVGWRGLLAGIVGEGCGVLGQAPLAAVVGPGNGAVLLRGGRGGGGAVPRGVRRGRRRRRAARPLDRVRARAAGGGLRRRPSGRPLHVLRAGDCSSRTGETAGEPAGRE